MICLKFLKFGILRSSSFDRMRNRRKGAGLWFGGTGSPFLLTNCLIKCFNKLKTQFFFCFEKGKDSV